MQDRRTFLKYLGVTAGATLLPACGTASGINVQFQTSPNGFRVSPIVSVGDKLPTGGVVAQLLGHFQWLVPPSGSPSLMFQAVDDSGKTGIYEFTVDASSGMASVTDMRPVLRQGDTLTDANDTVPSGRTVSRHTVWDANAAGSAVVVVETDGAPPAIYLDRERAGFKHLASQATKMGASRFAAALGHVRLADNHDLLLVAGYVPGPADARGPQTRTGLYHFADAAMDAATLVLATGDLAPGGGVVSHLGLPDLGPNHTWSAAVGVGTIDGCNAQSRGFTGNAMDAMSTTNQQSTGETVFFQSRLDPGGDLAQVVNLSASDQQLRYRGATLLKTGDASPSGRPITSIHAPVFAQAGTVLVEVTTDASMEILQFDGHAWRLLLSTGDELGTRQVEALLFGTFSRQADASNRFTALVDFGDNNGGQSIVLAVPV